MKNEEFIDGFNGDNFGGSLVINHRLSIKHSLIELKQCQRYNEI